MSANGLHDDIKRSIALECAVEVTAGRGSPEATREAAEQFLAFLSGSERPARRLVVVKTQ